ncbi:MAG: OadG family protein [Clostridia bacterium]|nr:OadG family protein [Clostridia bacterium]
MGILSMLSSLVAASSASTANENPIIVFLLGVGTVFACLIAIIFIIWAMGRLFRSKRVETRSASNEREVVKQSFVVNEKDSLLDTPERQQVVAAVSAAVAEYMGEDVSGIRIRSIKRI